MFLLTPQDLQLGAAAVGARADMLCGSSVSLTAFGPKPGPGTIGKALANLQTYLQTGLQTSSNEMREDAEANSFFDPVVTWVECSHKFLTQLWQVFSFQPASRIGPYRTYHAKGSGHHQILTCFAQVPG